MAIKTMLISDVYGAEVFTDTGDFFGVVKEAVLGNNKVTGWRVEAVKGSYLSKVLGGAKGVIVPHNLVKSMGDVMIISRNALPSYDESAAANVEKLESGEKL
ncbi:PRC-barrel domain-containing protein [Candidatus Woesearchaeota archaeon]|nr:PRC-barrel domain-containing protein [Candidatus Woesearchaeota archaeon]